MNWWNKLGRNGKVVVGVGGGVVLLLGYRWWKNRQASSSTASSSSGIDPATGIPYATELAQAQGGGATTTEPSATLQTPGGFSYSGPASGIGSILSASTPTGAVATTASSTPNAGYSYISSPSTADSLAASGQQLFYQPAGLIGSSYPYFPYSAAANVPGGQPGALFVQNPAAVTTGYPGK